jgi:orotate phosphoribosyltransferase-like protein
MQWLTPLAVWAAAPKLGPKTFSENLSCFSHKVLVKVDDVGKAIPFSENLSSISHKVVVIVDDVGMEELIAGTNLWSSGPQISHMHSRNL